MYWIYSVLCTQLQFPSFISMSVSTSNHVINYNNGRVVGTLSTSEYVHMCFFYYSQGLHHWKKAARGKPYHTEYKSTARTAPYLFDYLTTFSNEPLLRLPLFKINHPSRTPPSIFHDCNRQQSLESLLVRKLIYWPSAHLSGCIGRHSCRIYLSIDPRYL